MEGGELVIRELSKEIEEMGKMRKEIKGIF